MNLADVLLGDSNIFYLWCGDVDGMMFGFVLVMVRLTGWDGQNQQDERDCMPGFTRHKTSVDCW